MLFETFKDMRSNKNNVPLELYLKLMTLHSYILVKKVVKL
jgi:WD repeat-containing protein 19